MVSFCNCLNQLLEMHHGNDVLSDSGKLDFNIGNNPSDYNKGLWNICTQKHRSGQYFHLKCAQQFRTFN